MDRTTATHLCAFCDRSVVELSTQCAFCTMSCDCSFSVGEGFLLNSSSFVELNDGDPLSLIFKSELRQVGCEPHFLWRKWFIFQIRDIQMQFHNCSTAWSILSKPGHMSLPFRTLWLHGFPSAMRMVILTLKSQLWYLQQPKLNILFCNTSSPSPCQVCTQINLHYFTNMETIWDKTTESMCVERSSSNCIIRFYSSYYVYFSRKILTT